MKAIVVKVCISSPGLKSERLLKKLKRYEQNGDTSVHSCNLSRKKEIHQSREVCKGIMTVSTVSSAARSKTWAELFEAGLALNLARISANPASNKLALY